MSEQVLFVTRNITMLRYNSITLIRSCSILDFVNIEMNKRLHLVQCPPNTFFIGKWFKKTTEYFLKFLFLIESSILPVNNGKSFHLNGCLGWPIRSVQLSALSIVCSCISPMTSRILSFKAEILSGLPA